MWRPRQFYGFCEEASVLLCFSLCFISEARPMTYFYGRLSGRTLMPFCVMGHIRLLPLKFTLKIQCISSTSSTLHPVYLLLYLKYVTSHLLCILL
uniref:Putative secreted protein n=1 Tax=Ixodes ricinus TaxID=34613 RepID=A0A6B0UE06_IXORI